MRNTQQDHHNEQASHDLLFAHWPVDARKLREKVPSALARASTYFRTVSTQRYAVRRRTDAFGRVRGAAGSHPIALSAGMLHVASGHRSVCAAPIGRILARPRDAPFGIEIGGARSGYANEGRVRSGPRLTISNRSVASAPPKKRNRKACGKGPAPSARRGSAH